MEILVRSVDYGGGLEEAVSSKLEHGGCGGGVSSSITCACVITVCVKCGVQQSRIATDTIKIVDIFSSIIITSHH